MSPKAFYIHASCHPNKPCQPYGFVRFDLAFALPRVVRLLVDAGADAASAVRTTEPRRVGRHQTVLDLGSCVPQPPHEESWRGRSYGGAAVWGGGQPPLAFARRSSPRGFLAVVQRRPHDHRSHSGSENYKHRLDTAGDSEWCRLRGKGPRHVPRCGGLCSCGCSSCFVPHSLIIAAFWGRLTRRCCWHRVFRTILCQLPA